MGGHQVEESVNQDHDFAQAQLLRGTRSDPREADRLIAWLACVSQWHDDGGSLTKILERALAAICTTLWLGPVRRRSGFMVGDDGGVGITVQRRRELVRIPRFRMRRMYPRDRAIRKFRTATQPMAISG
jgi:hypothetical protein